jgi:hypothetical protein
MILSALGFHLYQLIRPPLGISCSRNKVDAMQNPKIIHFCGAIISDMRQRQTIKRSAKSRYKMLPCPVRRFAGVSGGLD